MLNCSINNKKYKQQTIIMSLNQQNNNTSHIDSLFQLIEGHTKSQKHQSLVDINNGNIFQFIRMGNLDAVKKKLHMAQYNSDELKLNLNHRSLSFSGRTILQEACAYNQFEIVKFLLETYCNNKRDVMENVQFDINKKSHIGQDTALHFAVRNNNKVITRILLNHRAKPNECNKYGCTPLHYVQSIEVAELLHCYGADSTLMDKEGRTPSMYIASTPKFISCNEFDELVQYLVDKEEVDTKEAIQRELRAHRIQKKRKQEL